MQALWRAAVLDWRPISAVEAVAVGFMHALDLSCWSQPVNMPHRATLCAPPSSTPLRLGRLHKPPLLRRKITNDKYVQTTEAVYVLGNAGATEGPPTATSKAM